MTVDWLHTMPLAVIDLETTGPEPDTARIVQVAVLQVDDGEASGEWCKLVNPGCPIPTEASEIHGIRDEDVRSAPSWAKLAPEFMAQIRGRGLVGYNARRYDWPIVLWHLEEAGVEARRREVLDVLVWARAIDRGGMGKGYHKLENLGPRWGVEVGEAHDALSDCRTTWGILCALAPKMPNLGVEKLLRHQERLYQADRRRFEAWLARQRAKEAVVG